MDELVLKQLTRQLKLLNIWITFFGTLMIIGFIVTGVLIYKVVTFTQDVSNNVAELKQKTQQTLDVQQKLCNTKSIGSLLQDKTKACN